MTDLPPSQIKTVKRILAQQVPGCEVRAFGSRVKMTAKAWSEPDLAVLGDFQPGRHSLSDLKDAFEESDLPIRVDALDWKSISAEFRRVIKEGDEVIQQASS